jgi:hypothetical protein
MSRDRSERRAVPRDVEAVVLASLIDTYPDEPTEAEVRRGLSTIEDTPERSAAISQAVAGLIAVGLVARSAGRLRATPPALRAGELELGL